MDFKNKIDLNRLPKHIAIIMDGNGRWAKQQGEQRIFGHHNGVSSVRETTETAAELGVKYLTLYAFSTENWNRPKEEVEALMELLVHTISKETPTLLKNGIKLETIGDIDSLPRSCIYELNEAKKATAAGDRMTLILALSYSAKWEIIRAVQQIAEAVKDGSMQPNEIDESVFASKLCTAGIPDPELMIRTSGEHRISNFLLWQLSYAEFYFTEVLWPDFRKEDLYAAIYDYQNRERRFGKTSEQIQ
ncbi:MAG: isoprenyl transferase [Bacteroidetes bacterium]|jgi:undecaprenyl diphosphate synthase|nr:isoprenyl transferase [Bacteroidota bacterium]